MRQKEDSEANEAERDKRRKEEKEMNERRTRRSTRLGREGEQSSSAERRGRDSGQAEGRCQSMLVCCCQQSARDECSALLSWSWRPARCTARRRIELRQVRSRSGPASGLQLPMKQSTTAAAGEGSQSLCQSVCPTVSRASNRSISQRVQTATRQQAVTTRRRGMTEVEGDAELAERGGSPMRASISYR